MQDKTPSTETPHGALFHNLLLFGRVLHELGVATSPGRMVELQTALGLIQIGRRADFYHALRCFLVHRQEEIPLFDAAFNRFWQPPPDEWNRSDVVRLADPEMDGHGALDAATSSDHTASEEALAEKDAGANEASEATELALTFSARERLRHRDFATLTPAEFDAIKRMMGELIWQLGQRRTRRHTPGGAMLVDMRRSLRNSLRTGGEILEWSRRAPKLKPRPLVVIADISGSMQPYTRLLLHFMYALSHGLHRRVEFFVFGTRLTRITHALRHRQGDRALTEVAASVQDWSSGTRIGAALRALNRDWSGRVLTGGSLVLLISDGWDRGDPQLLGQEMARLHRLCRRLVWLNPLLGDADYQPLTRGMAAALPHVDDFLPAHNLASLSELADHLRRLERSRAPKQGVGHWRSAALAAGR